MKITILALKDGVWQVYPDQTVALLGLLQRYIFMLVLFFLAGCAAVRERGSDQAGHKQKIRFCYYAKRPIKEEQSKKKVLYACSPPKNTQSERSNA